jgi:esterase/lipase superfamily enzyme
MRRCGDRTITRPALTARIDSGISRPDSTVTGHPLGRKKRMSAPRCLRVLLFALAAVVALAPAGCQGRNLVATPNLLLHEDPQQVFAACPAVCQAPDMEVIYGTDRDAVQAIQGPSYGYGRARRLAFGVATVTLDPEPTWKDLIADSTRADRRLSYTLRAGRRQEMGSFDPMWDKLEPHDGGIQLASEAVSELKLQRKILHDLLTERLAQTPAKDVYLFVHGVNNSFDDAVFRAAEVWHFLGRTGVPVVYSWPAGYGGIRGYAYDRESGEFTVYHFKNFLRTVASCPAVERVHLVAHSRGTDVAIAALRELNIAYQAQGKDTRQELKLENVVLAAPDLDEEVFLQRFVAENLLRAAGRTTIYASPRDKAIELAQLVFGGDKRVGELGPRDLSPQARAALAKLPTLQLIDCKVSSYSTSHDYVFAHPAALSDLILLLRDRRGPGAENGRPLLQPVEGVWELHNDYPVRAKAAAPPP